MRRNLWIRAVLVAAVGAATAGPTPDARAADGGPAPSTEGYRAALLAADTPTPARDEAARRLAADRTPAAVAALGVALARNSPPAAQMAAARAIAGTTDPDPAWLQPLAALLGPNRVVTDAAANGLGNYAASPHADQAFDALHGFASNPNVPPFTRAPAVRPMGAFVFKRAAAALVDLLDDRNQTVQQAAMNGLTDMTGEADRGNVPGNWRAWWAGHRGDSDAGWQAYLLAARVREAGPARVRQNTLVEDVRQQMESDFYSLPDAARKDHLDGYLRAGSAVIRAEGAKLALDKLQVLNSVLPRMRELIADDDPSVRLAAVAAVQGANDQLAGPALVAQLGRERDGAIRIKLTQALDKLQDLDAARPLLKVLDDPRPDVATAAARALRGIGAALRQQRPVDAADVAAALERILAVRPPPGPGADEFRAACVGALAVVEDPQRSIQTFRGMLNASPPESRDVRVAVLNGFGTVGDTKADAIVAMALGDADEPAIRLAAARALVTVGTEGQADQLNNMLNPQNEPDASVRDAAWQALSHLLENGSVAFLQDWVKPNQFKDDPARRLVVEQAYGRALRAAKQADEAAKNDEEIGNTLLKLNRPDEAIGPYQATLDYYQKNAPAGGGGDLDNLVREILAAKLKARQYTAATTFASQEIKQYPSYQPTAGRAFQDAAEELKAAGDGTDLDALIQAASAIQPPLESLFIDNLKAIRESPTRP